MSKQIQDKLFFKILIIFLISITFISCSKLPGGATSRSNKPYLEFFIKEGVLQYFVKPLYLKSKENKMSIDFTMRSDVENDGYIVCNFSILSKDSILDLKEVIFNLNIEKAPLIEINKLYGKKDKLYSVRYNSKMNFKYFSKFVKCQNPTILIGSQQFAFKASELKKIKTIKTDIVNVIEE